MEYYACVPMLVFVDTVGRTSRHLWNMPQRPRGGLFKSFAQFSCPWLAANFAAVDHL